MLMDLCCCFQINEEVRELQKKLAQVEQDLIDNKNNLEQANKDLEEKEKTLTATESEVATQNRKVQQIEEDLEKSEERLGSATSKLVEASAAADENNRSLFKINFDVKFIMSRC